MKYFQASSTDRLGKHTDYIWPLIREENLNNYKYLRTSKCSITRKLDKQLFNTINENKSKRKKVSRTATQKLRFNGY